MGYSSLILKAVAAISFAMALEVAAVEPQGSVVLLASALGGFGICWSSAVLAGVLTSRAAMAPWILSAAAVVSASNSGVAITLGCLGGLLVGVSLTEWRAYNRMVPALGLPMIVSIIASDERVGITIVPWLVVVAAFALLTNHMQFEGTSPVLNGRSLNNVAGGHVHRPVRALQAIGVFGLCVGLSSFLVPLVKAPQVDIGFAAFGGDLGGPQLSVHPGLQWGELDTGRRVDLDDNIVLRVKADRPDYWRGVTYTNWDGRTWTNSDNGTRYTWPSEGVTLSNGRPGGELSRQQFTVERAGLNVIHGAYKIEALWSTQRAGLVRSDGSVTLDEPLGAGAKWTVRSSVRDITPDSLRAADPLALGVSGGIKEFATESDVQPRVAALAAEITAGIPNTYDKVKALEAWIDDNIKYSRDIAPLPEGADAVEQLLFVDQLGYCEQIGSSLVVMLRSLGIPSRLVVGYVPGGYDESTGEWISRSSDAHAWAEVYFPGIGWQGFDPTSGVPLSGDELTQNNTESEPANWNLIARILLGFTSVAAVGALVSNLLARSKTGPDVRLQTVDALGARLERDWTEAMTIRERLADLSSLGIDEQLTSQVAAGLEHVSYAQVPSAGRLPVDDQIADLETAVDQLLKVPT